MNVKPTNIYVGLEFAEILLADTTAFVRKVINLFKEVENVKVWI